MSSRAATSRTNSPSPLEAEYRVESPATQLTLQITESFDGYAQDAQDGQQRVPDGSTIRDRDRDRDRDRRAVTFDS